MLLIDAHVCFPNSIADELLEEQLGQVTAEIADMCDECVDGLYSAEFVVPKTIHK